MGEDIVKQLSYHRGTAIGECSECYSGWPCDASIASDEIKRLCKKADDAEMCFRQAKYVSEQLTADRRALVERAWKDGNGFAFEGCNADTTDEEFDAIIAQRIDALATPTHEGDER